MCRTAKAVERCGSWCLSQHDSAQGEEAFLPLEKADHSIQLWEHLPEAAKHFIRWRMAEFSGSSDLRHREELRLTLSQAAYEAVRRQKDGVEGVA